MLKQVRDSMKAGTTDVNAIKAFLDFEITALKAVHHEILDESMVVKGHLSEVCADARGQKTV